ncbi:MAG TPA: exodeoxyribonuclease VII large subunit, partial [Casimicrobiaceae bacterium]
AALEHRAIQLLRYRLAMLHRRLDQQGVGRAAMLLQRAMNRWSQRVDDQDYRLRDRMRFAVDVRRKTVDQLTGRLRGHDPRPRLERQRALLAKAERALAEHITRRLHGLRRRLDPVEAKLGQLSPLRILDRGYAIVTRPDGALVKVTAEVSSGAPIKVRLSDGTFGATVD